MKIRIIQLLGFVFEHLQHVLFFAMICLFVYFVLIQLAFSWDLLVLPAIVGDITPSDGVPKAEKSRREQEALNEMCKILGGGLRGINA